MERKVKYGIIGCGMIAPRHAEAILKAENAELAAVCDIIEEKAVSFAEKFGVKDFYTNYHELISRDDIDIVSICVPSGARRDIVINAAKKHKHILSEKPLEITKEKMADMINACHENGVLLGGVFQRRTMKAAVYTRKLVQEGKLGRIVMANVYVKHVRTQEYYNSAGWRGTWALDGGGCLMNQGIHGIDLVQWMVGDIESVMAYADHLVRKIEVEDTAVAAMKYKNGAFGVIQGATSIYGPEEIMFEIHGEKGTIAFGDNGFVKFNVEGVENELATLGAEVSYYDHYELVKDMTDAVINNREPMVSGTEARKAVDLILAIYESAKTGSMVKI
jgi:predicted dehydrogenase